MTALASLSREGEIAVIAVQNPPVNALSPGVPEAIVSALREAQAEDGVLAIVLIGSGRTFIAGADIREFVKMTEGTRACKVGLEPLMSALEDSPKPVIAAIHGNALGGGLETAMACHYRVAVPSARVGQPEVKLGLIPGAGGTQRLPRLAGVERALEMCTSGAAIPAPRALEWGIIDRLARGDLREEAIAFAREIVSEGKGTRRTRDLRDKLLDLEGAVRLTESAAERVEHQARGQVAPQKAVDAIEAATFLPFEEGLRREEELFFECLHSSQSKSLIHVFFSERESSKIPGLAKGAVVPETHRAAVAAKEVPAEMTRLLGDAGIALEEGEGNLGRADLVLAWEGPEMPEGSWAALEKRVRPDAILVGVPGRDALRSAGELAHPERWAGLSVFGPSGGLTEIVRGPSTRPEVLASVMGLVRRADRIGIVTAPGVGSATVRLLERAKAECKRLGEEGVRPIEIRAAMDDFGFSADSPIRPQGAADETLRGVQADRAGTIVERLVCALILEGATLLEGGVVARAADLDLITIRGLGFPAHRGGALWHADEMGLPEVLAFMRSLQAELGDAWRPSPLIERLASEGGRFHA